MVIRAVWVMVISVAGVTVAHQRSTSLLEHDAHLVCSRQVAQDVLGCSDIPLGVA
jgi:hypothetical protein